MNRIFLASVVVILAACAHPPKQEGDGGCSVSIVQDGVQVPGSNPLDGVTIFSLKRKPFVIQVPSASCNASIGNFKVFERMRSLGAAKSKIFTTTGFEMAASPEEFNTLPVARDGERISSSDLEGFLGQEGTRNYQSVCKNDGKCPIPFTAFRSYHNFRDRQSGQPSNQAQIALSKSQPVSLMVYTEVKRFPRSGSNGNWPADILLEPHPILLMFSN